MAGGDYVLKEDGIHQMHDMSPAAPCTPAEYLKNFKYVSYVSPIPRPMDAAQRCTTPSLTYTTMIPQKEFYHEYPRTTRCEYTRL